MENNKSNKDKISFLSEIRQYFADYVYSEGCSCCQNRDEHKKAEHKLGKLLDAEPYNDNSGYNWSKYKSK